MEKGEVVEAMTELQETSQEVEEEPIEVGESARHSASSRPVRRRVWTKGPEVYPVIRPPSPRVDAVSGSEAGGASSRSAPLVVPVVRLCAWEASEPGRSDGGACDSTVDGWWMATDV